MSKPLARLVSALGFIADPEWERIDITGVSEDSRKIRPGEIFVAIPGFVTDGHKYIGDAVSRGAAAVIGERAVPCSVPLLTVPNARIALACLSSAFFDAPTRKLFTVGVTGTNGKTTVCHLVFHLLGEGKSALLSTVETERQGMHAVTTPESPLIQRFAREALTAGKENLILEVSSAGLSLHRTDYVDFDVAIFTNLTHDHLDFHADRESYLAAKLRLFEGLPQDAVAIINLDDPAAQRFISATRARVFTYAIHRPADLWAVDPEYQLKETSFTLKMGKEAIQVQISLPAEHNVYNALAAAGVALVKGLKLDEIADRLATARPVEGRYQFFRAKNGAAVIVDFAHSPDSLERMLRSLRPHYQRIICVFGCGGESDKKKRPLMGRISGELSDITILTTDNPKDEPPAQIIDEIEEGIRPTGGTYERIVDRKDAIRRAITLSKPGDVVLLAGKGHEPYQIVGHKFIPYSDAGFLQKEGLVE